MDEAAHREIREAIEAFLLERRDWVPVRDLAAHFGVRERALRALDGACGLCSDYAISSDAGLKHVAVASTAEWLRFKHRLRRHAINELRRTRSLGRRRSDVTRRVSSLAWEKDTGQGVFLPCQDLTRANA